MLLVEIGTATAISAYFYMHITSDPIGRQPVQLSDYLFAFGYGLVFWLLVLLRAKLHGSGDRQADIRKVAKLAKLIAPITTLNLCGCLLAPFMKLPLLVRFLVLFQVSSNLALLLIWAFLSLKECMNLPDAHIQQQQKSSPEPQAVQQQRRGAGGKVEGRGGKVDIAGGSGSEHGSGASGSEENRGRYGGGTSSDMRLPDLDYPDMRLPDMDLDYPRPRLPDLDYPRPRPLLLPSGLDYPDMDLDYPDMRLQKMDLGLQKIEPQKMDLGLPKIEPPGMDLPEIESILEEIKKLVEGPQEIVPSVVQVDIAGGRGTNTGQDFKNSEIIKMSLALTAQTTGTLMGFRLIPTPSSSSKVVLVVALMDQLVAFLCVVTGILLSSNKPEDLNAAKIFAGMGIFCYKSGYILMIAMCVVMFVPWYSVLIAVLLNIGVVWLIFFRNGLTTRAIEVWKRINFYLFSLLFLAFVVPCSSANTGQDFDNSEIIKISLGLTAQTTGTLMGFNLIPTPSSSSKAVLVVALMAQLVAFLCGATGILLSLNTPGNLIAGKIFGNMTFVSYMLGYILMIAMYVDMFVPWYSVLIVVLLFGVVWLILFWNELKNRATEVWSWLKSRAPKSI